MRSVRAVLILALSAWPAIASAQQSAAARWLAEQSAQEHCGGPGRFGPDGLVERDFTGDGRADLLLYTGGLTCDGRQAPCGAIYCLGSLYVREGDLLVEKHAILTQCAEVVPGDPPGVTYCNRDGSRYTVRWDGWASPSERE